MTRFQAKALPNYKPEPYQSPLAGIWNIIAAYYSTSPRFRDWFANLFASKKGGETGYEQAFDTALSYPGLVETPKFGSEAAASDVSEMLVNNKPTGVGWLDRIAEGVRTNNDYHGGAITRDLLANIPALKTETEDIPWPDLLK
ncbi:hypothetical protein [Fibrobacter sp.]|uniref:hypothetical protein n=1 Tax=Fibrobacter sp. TaxID=35828 RepID=UPI00388E9A46